MTKLKKILEPQGPAIGEHPDNALLAGFLDGRMDTEQRSKIVSHLSGCRDCYEVVQQSLGDIEAARQTVQDSMTGHGRRRVFAIAASFILCVLVASGLYFRGGFAPPQQAVQIAAVELDDELRDLLLEDEALVWTGDKAERLARMLAARGIATTGAETVMLAASYDPYATKGLTKKKESLGIRIEKGVIHIEIMQQENHEK